VKPEEQMADYVPWLARRNRIGGEVLLSCVIDERNRARRCIVLSEKPAGHGYGPATLRLSRLFRIKPPMVDGKVRHDIRVGIPIRYDPR
jgi:protein TonB